MPAVADIQSEAQLVVLFEELLLEDHLWPIEEAGLGSQAARAAASCGEAELHCHRQANDVVRGLRMRSFECNAKKPSDSWLKELCAYVAPVGPMSAVAPPALRVTGPEMPTESRSAMPRLNCRVP